MATKIPKAVPAADGILKPKKDNIPVARKNVAAKANKAAPSNRGVQQAELRDQKHLLVTANEDLHKNLSETQQRVDELEQQFSELQKENTNMKKSLNDCHVALIAAKIDPGETVGEIAQKEDQRREVQNVSRDLLNELKTFGDVASTQVVQLEAINTTIKDLTEARLGLMQERDLFSHETAEMERALEEAEGLLA